MKSNLEKVDYRFCEGWIDSRTNEEVPVTGIKPDLSMKMVNSWTNPDGVTCKERFGVA